ncbi:TonB-dependent receptor [Lysobacter soyae]|uniref:TonB-dependent receptor n=1 Tax=Lysobacter soyae TaxID=2764185 RepID=A0ABX8WLM7_9GAMM|nr:TonB-dependent receptor [Lysobacter sp. CJ11]QYR52540.1 TonB-dependent receptor [Lysobacter sp. CJ11]
MRNPNQLRKSKLALGLMAALVAAPVFAQSTSASVGGQVTANGSPVAGAEVVITHVESGTTSRVTTDANGRYNARGLRVGGPYTIAVNKAGSGSDTENNVYLSVNQTTQVDAQLEGGTAAGTFDAITVSAIDAAVFSPLKAGAGTNVTRQTLESLPSSSGNIQDYMRLDPRVTFIDRASGSISAAGQNPRYNSIRVDGVSASDTFGLEGNNMPTRRQPVAMDAIEALDIDLSNYDVTITGGTGAVVNAVTKSGTNEFHGSIYSTFRDGEWFGRAPRNYGLDKVNGDTFKGFTQEKTLGATLGGPIVKDKLFFFANYEKFEQAAPGADLAASPYGAGRISDADIARVQSTFQSRYGVPAGGLVSNGDTTLTERALKLDWNISDAHRMSVRYSDLEQSKLRLNGFSTTAASLSSYWYQHDKNIKNYVAQLFSDWSDNFSTEMKVSFRDYAAVRNTPTEGTPEIRISYGTSLTDGVAGSPYLFLGTEVNSQYNELYTKTWNYYGAGTWILGNHNIKFGADYATNDIYNVFAPYVDGQYYYNNVNAFVANTPSYSLVRTPLNGDVDNMAAKYKYNALGLFVQDQWYVTDALTLTYGLRADRYTTDHKPPYNAAAQSVWGYNNTDIGGGKFLIQPRIGFNYKLSDDSLAQIRGGVGLFQGDSPQVWLGNSFNTYGPNYTQVERYYNSTRTPTPPSQSVNFLSPDFEQPSVWKANLALDVGLPWYNMIFSAELMATEANTSLYYKRLDLVSPTRQGPDGRDMYWANTPTLNTTARSKRPNGWGDVFLLEASDKGSSQQFTVSLSKPFTKTSDWSWSLAYTYTNANEISALTSSTASSGWGTNPVFNANDDAVGRSRYEIRDRLSGNLTWKHNFFGDYQTKVGLVYEGRSGRPYSWVYFNDMNGDSRTFNDLLYVPSGRGDVQFGTLSGTGVFTNNQAMEDAFFAYLDGNRQLSRYKGRVAPVNGGRASWVNLFDLRLSQELPGFWKGHKAELWMDVQNVGNMISRDWGNVIDYGFNSSSAVANYVGINPATGKYVYSYTSAQTPNVANGDADGFNVGISQWSVSVGLRYKF